jgi:AbrB family transcriptional regulator (stage V sporulation protein T)
MKATGIVRRIDDLGRVVIPKEIRRTMRIREGDPLEIYTDREGEVIFKKYSPIGELSAFSSQYAEAMWKTCGIAVIICDRDAVIACAGVPKKEYLEKRVSEKLESVMSGRSLYVSGSEEHVCAVHDGGVYTIGCAMPIVNEGDVIGCVAAIHSSDSKESEIGGDLEQKLVSTAASFLGKQMES